MATSITLTTNSSTSEYTLATGGRGPVGPSPTVVDAVTNGDANAVSSNAVFDALALKASLAGATFTGPVILDSTTRPTSAGTGTPNATDLITRGDGDARFGAIALTSALASDGPAVSSSTVLVDSGITLTLPAGTYELSGLLYVAGAPPKAQLTLDSSSGVSCALMSHLGITGGGSTLAYMTQGAIAAFALGNTATTSGAFCFRLSGRIVLTETRTLKIQYAQNSSSGFPTNAKKESFLTATPR